MVHVKKGTKFGKGNTYNKKWKKLTNDWPEVNSKGEIQIISFRHELYGIRFRSLLNKMENMHLLHQYFSLIMFDYQFQK